MKKYTFHPLLAFFIITVSCLLFVTACKKEEMDKTPLTKTDLLSRLPWKLLERGVDSNKNGRLEALENTMLDCEYDDLYHFGKDGIGLKEQQRIKCANTSEDRYAFVWEFLQDETQIEIYPLRAHLLLLTKDTFTMRAPSGDYSYYYKFVH